MADANIIFKSIMKQVGKRTPIISILVDAFEDIERQKDSDLMMQIYQMLKMQNDAYISQAKKVLKEVESKVRQTNYELAEQSQQIGNQREKNIFLYLASKNFANATQTNDLAITTGFVWRSYYKKGVNQHVNHVNKIRENDLIVLAYRTKDPTRFGSFFNVLNVFMVKKDNGMGYRSCDGIESFVYAGGELSTKLAELKYKKDQRLKEFVGIPLVLKNFDMDKKDALKVYQEGFWKCPAGNDTIWPLFDKDNNESQKIPKPVRDWMKTL